MTEAPAARRSPALGAIYALVGAALFGINGSMAKVVMAAGITPEQLTFARTLATTIIAAIILLVTDRSQFRVTRRELAGLALLGLAGLAMIQWMYAVSISRLPVGVALLFEYTAVVIVATFAFLVFKERVHRRLWWAIGGVLAGLAVVGEVWDSSLDGLGVAAGLGAAVCYAFYFLAGERGVARRSPFAVAFWAALFAAAFWGALSGWWRVEPASLAEPVSLDGALAEVVVPMWAPLLWIATFGGFAPFVLILMSLRHISATASGIIASAEVLFAFLVAWLWLGETLAPVPLAGAAVVLAAIVVAQTARERTAPTPEVPPEVP